MNSTGIILAAGASRRMGRPKALLPFAGETFLDHLIELFTRVTGEPPIVVLGHQADVIRQGMRRPFQLALNPDPERGQLSSFQCALPLLATGTDAFLFTPVDYPSFQESTVAALLQSMEQNASAMLVIPRCEGRRGHPVVCRRSVADEFLALPLTAKASDVVHAYRDRTIYVDVDDAGIYTDIDQPADYERLMQVSRQ